MNNLGNSLAEEEEQPPEPKKEEGLIIQKKYPLESDLLPAKKRVNNNNDKRGDGGLPLSVYESRKEKLVSRLGNGENPGSKIDNL